MKRHQLIPEIFSAVEIEISASPRAPWPNAGVNKRVNVAALNVPPREAMA